MRRNNVLYRTNNINKTITVHLRIFNLGAFPESIA